jgi:hypothetical protein
MSSRKNPKKLVVSYNVTDLSKDEIGQLAQEAQMQNEASDGMGGKHFDGKTGHPDVPVLDTRVVKRGKSQYLVVEFDVTGLTKTAIGHLASEAEVQAEASDAEEWVNDPSLNTPGHPNVAVTSKVVSRAKRSR